MTKQEEQVWTLLASVTDPEVPVLTILDLGIVRSIETFPNEPARITIRITPTYSGCPAMDVIGMQIRMRLLEARYQHIQIEQVLSPAWTTDWMSEEGRNKLKAYGIAPPHYKQTMGTPDAFQEEEAVQCPQCHSWHTELVSQFGSTACKSLYRCLDCKEPFDHFKCH
jgi:ring-1,2-phenylacetyl-CoA epoxidase subunit PaaD